MINLKTQKNKVSQQEHHTMDTVLLKDIVLLILGGVIGLVASFVTLNLFEKL